MSSHPTLPAAGSAAPAHHEENQLMVERREKLSALRQQQADGKGVAFPNDIKPEHRAEQLFAQYGHLSNEELEPLAVKVHVAGRMMLKRVMGKASFATLQDASFGATGGRIQLYINNAGVGDGVHAAFKHWDLGDIVAATGTLFRTKTGELSVNADSIRLVTKSLRPLPDKFHGMADQEVKYRQRYVDLIMVELARKRFMARSKAVSGLREFMVANDFLEVETPMLHPL
ncbi:MAG: lysyl-tRNA synthetase, partial [Polaromonas sp.]|nr:lysyl-tRNA synthetase [Polaromonas sp.]